MQNKDLPEWRGNILKARRRARAEGKDWASLSREERRRYRRAARQVDGGLKAGGPLAASATRKNKSAPNVAPAPTDSPGGRDGSEIPPLEAIDCHRLLTRNPFQRIRHIPGQPITYLKNPKVATTSILLAQWARHDPQGVPANPHGPKAGPFINDAHELDDRKIATLTASKFFSVVRNPYSRFLSGYLNKVRGRPWHKISGKFGFASDSIPTIHELLAALSAMDPYGIDHHFRPQHINLLFGFAPLDFIGYFEMLDSVKAFLGSHGFVLSESKPRNATGASDRVKELLDDRAVKAIQVYYEADFLHFGYSLDPAQAAPAQPVAVRGNERRRAALEAYIRRLRSRTAPQATRPRVEQSD